jgi:alpha-D-xyloside xylohydrolase
MSQSKRTRIILCIFIILGHSAVAQNYIQTANGIKTTVNDIIIELQVFSKNIIRVVKYPADSALKKQSLSVVKTPESLAPNITEREGKLMVSTPEIMATLDMQTGKVAFAGSNGAQLFAEKDYGVQFTPINDAGRNTYSVRQAFLLDKQEILYGLGQQPNGRLNQRNQKLLLAQSNTKVCIPYFQSIKGYGIFWDNYSPTVFTDNKQETSFDSQVGDYADYYFMQGANADDVIAQMRDLTGQAPMMPLWTFGYNQSKERYKTQFELLDVVKKYRALRVPLDGIVQDWQYWGKDSVWNAMSFDPSTYPEPKKMVDSIHNLNAHLFIVSWPGFGPKTKQQAEFRKNNMLINFATWPPNSGTVPYDVYNPVARERYWAYLDKGVFSLGTDAWWLDSSEPDHPDEKESDFDLPTFMGPYRDVRNAFPLEHIRGVYENQRKTTSAKRVSILTRSAFAGQQRYGSNTWSGDIGSTWQSFRTQIPAGLNFSLTGIPYWNTDIGGFFAGHYAQKGGSNNKEFQELYTRWIQFGTFMPLMRSHGTDIPREIYNFGKKGDAVYDAIEKYINLRYSLLPYTYATAWNVTSQSGSFMRALFMDFQNDTAVYNIGNQYMFGKSIMVTPVTEQGSATQAVYLPKGTGWFDFWTGEILTGGQQVNKATPIDILPLYVKAGSIIPWGPAVQYATEKKWDNLEIRIYPGANADFTLYEDENDNYNYEKGAYSQTSFHWSEQAKTLTVEAAKGSFPGMLPSRKFKIVLVNQDSKTGLGSALSAKANKVIDYTGKKVVVNL